MSEENAQSENLTVIGTAAAVRTAAALKKRGYKAVADGCDLFISDGHHRVHVRNHFFYCGNVDAVQEEFAKAIAHRLSS